VQTWEATYSGSIIATCLEIEDQVSVSGIEAQALVDVWDLPSKCLSLQRECPPRKPPVICKPSRGLEVRVLRQAVIQNRVHVGIGNHQPRIAGSDGARQEANEARRQPDIVVEQYHVHPLAVVEAREGVPNGVIPRSIEALGGYGRPSVHRHLRPALDLGEPRYGRGIIGSVVENDELVEFVEVEILHDVRGVLVKIHHRDPDNAWWLFSRPLGNHGVGLSDRVQNGALCASDPAVLGHAPRYLS